MQIIVVVVVVVWRNWDSTLSSFANVDLTGGVLL